MPKITANDNEPSCCDNACYDTGCCAFTAKQCECLISNTIVKEDYSRLFIPETIKNKKIRSVDLYSANSNRKVLEQSIHFNGNGLVVKVENLYKDTVRSHRKYDRGASGQLLTETFSYFFPNSKSETIWDVIEFKYDDSNSLIETKKKIQNSEITKDTATDFAKYEYDVEKRIIKIREHFYYGEFGSSDQISEIKYFNKNQKSITEIREKGKNRSTHTKLFDAQGNLTKSSVFNTALNKLAYETEIFYDNNRMVRSVHKIGSGGATECPDSGFYEVAYFYLDSLLTTVDYKYSNNNCRLILKYN